MLVVYEGNDEIIVFEKKYEEKECAEYFSHGKRNLDDYERCEVKASINIKNSIRAIKYNN